MKKYMNRRGLLCFQCTSNPDCRGCSYIPCYPDQCKKCPEDNDCFMHINFKTDNITEKELKKLKNEYNKCITADGKASEELANLYKKCFKEEFE